MKLSERFARVRAKKPAALPPAAPAPAKRSRKYGLTCGELNAAIDAVCADQDDCSMTQTLKALWRLTDNAADGDTVSLTGPAPVTCAQLDEVLADVQGWEPELSAGTLTALKRVRALLAHAEEQKAKEPVQYVTVAQLKAFEAAMYDVIGWQSAAVGAELNQNSPSASHLRDQLGRSANTAERQKVLAVAAKCREEPVRQRTQEEFLRYQVRGHY